MSMDNPPEVQVGIMSEYQVEIVFKGEYYFTNIDKQIENKISAGILNQSIEVLTKYKQILFNRTLKFIPSDYENCSFILKNVTIGKGFHWEQAEDQEFRGTLVLRKIDEKLTAINILPVEDYLKSVISSEMNANCNLELLKTHAIISRSWLLRQIEKRNDPEHLKFATYHTYNSENERIRWFDAENHEFFDVCADDHCQRYQGVSLIRSEKVVQAVEETRGIVLSCDNKICDTRFSKACGGITESFENVWEANHFQYLTSIVDSEDQLKYKTLNLKDEAIFRDWILNPPDSFCKTTDKEILSQILPEHDMKTPDFFRWQVELTQEEISRLIREKSGIDFGNIIDLQPIERGVSGRIVRLKITGMNKTLIIGKELEIRRVLSESHLYSSAFFVEKFNIINKIPRKFVLYGAGWGHGVGLCQIGAAVMSEKGYTASQILTHYYKNTIIKKYYE